MTIDLPWLTTALARFVPVVADLPHALLIHGPAGVGKRMLATAIARSLLCEATADRRRPGGCGACSACRWFDEGNHPDFRFVTSEALSAGADAEAAAEEGEGSSRATKRAPSQEIKVEQVRRLADFLGVATHRGGPRIVQIQPLEAMNAVAANALLKMLEEPPARTVFVGVTDRLDALLPTIVSRCQKIAVALPSRADALAALERAGVGRSDDALAAAGGAPLAALAIANDAPAQETRDAVLAFLERPEPALAVALADGLAKADADGATQWIQRWIADCVSHRLAKRVRYHPARSARLSALVEDVATDRLLAFDSRLLDIRRTIAHPLNQRLLFETLLLDYCDAMRPTRALAR